MKKTTAAEIAAMAIIVIGNFNLLMILNGVLGYRLFGYIPAIKISLTLTSVFLAILAIIHLNKIK